MKNILSICVIVLLVSSCTDSEGDSVLGSSDNISVSLNCSTESLKDSSGVKIICNGDSIGFLLNGKNAEIESFDVKNESFKGCFTKKIQDDNSKRMGVVITCNESESDTLWNGIDGMNGESSQGCVTKSITDKVTERKGLVITCEENEPDTLWNGIDGMNGEPAVGCFTEEIIDEFTGKTGVNVYCGSSDVVTIWNGESPLMDNEPRCNVIVNGEYFLFACEKDTTKIYKGFMDGTCATIRSIKNDFVSIEQVLKCLKPDEKVAFIIRHAARDEDKYASTDGLNELGRAQTLELGKRLKEFPDFYYMHTNFYRAIETAMLIARGKEQVISDSAVLYTSAENEYHLMTNDIKESWFVKNESKVENCKIGGSSGWTAYAHFAYDPNACTDAFYNVDIRREKLVKTYFTYENMHKMTLAVSHDQFVTPFLISMTGRQINLMYHLSSDNRYYWTNYLAGAAIIVNKYDEVIYVPVKGLESGRMTNTP